MRHNDLRVSVVMSVYNGEPHLARAVESILQQDFEDFEFLVIDDGSTDRSRDLLRSFSDQRLIVLEQENQGLPRALNRGIRHARAPLIARMDADDFSAPNRLRLQVEFLDSNRDHVAVGSNANVVDREGRYIYTTEEPVEHEALRLRLPHTPFIHSSSVFRKEAFYAAGQYCERMIVGQDTVLFNRMAREGKIANLAAPLVEYRIVPTANSARERGTAEFMRIMRKAIEHNEVSSEEAAFLAKRTEDRHSKSRLVNYHNFLAKKLLWNSFRPKDARRYLKKSYQAEPNLSAAMLYAVSYLPERVVRRVYWAAKQLVP